MHSRMKQLTISLILLTSLMLPSITVAAQETNGDWSRLNAVASGSKLSVKLKSGKTTKGKLRSVSDGSLTLLVNNAPVELRRDDVVSVHEVRGKSATKSTLIGLGVGAGAGALIGAAGDASIDGGGFEKIDNVTAAGVTVLGAGVGALTGFLVGKGRSKRVLIYQAR